MVIGFLKGIWQFCGYLFWPQWKRGFKMEEGRWKFFMQDVSKNKSFEK